MKVLFLDIDGVLNHENHYKWLMKTDELAPIQRVYPYSEFNPESCKILNRIIEETGCNIVLSSSWKLDGINRMNILFKHFGLPRIYDITPSLCERFGSLCRGKEIDDWLSKHPDVTKYVIVDDESDVEKHQLPYFIKTNAYTDGLNEEIAKKIIKILNCD